MKRVNVLNLEDHICERNVIKKILSLLNEVDVELVLMAHNKKRQYPFEPWFLKRCARYGYTELLFVFVDNRRFSLLHSQKQDISYSAAKGGHCDTFELVLEKYNLNLDERHFGMLAKHGHLNLLKQYELLLTHFNEKMCIYAAEGGQVKVLQYLRVVGCGWDERVCRAAATYRQLDALKWLKENGCPWKDEEITAWACQNGDLEMLEWAILNAGCKYDTSDLIDIVLSEGDEEGHLHILCWIKHLFGGLGEIGKQITGVIVNGNLNILKWLYANYDGYKHKRKFCTYAAELGYLDMLKWLIHNGCEWNTKKVCKALAAGGHTEMLLWVRDHGAVWTKACLNAAIENNHFETADMLRQHLN